MQQIISKIKTIFKSSCILSFFAGHPVDKLSPIDTKKNESTIIYFQGVPNLAPPLGCRKRFSPPSINLTMYHLFCCCFHEIQESECIVNLTRIISRFKIIIRYNVVFCVPDLFNSSSVLCEL